jgi:hypothetical protein
MLELRLASRDGAPLDRLRPRIEEIVGEHLASIPRLADDVIAGVVDVY